jgi:hypothetical protein
MLSNLRMEAYPYYRQPIYPAGGADGGPLSLETNESAGHRGRQSLDGLHE